MVMTLLTIFSLFFVDQAELDCLTEAIYYEAGNQSIIGKASVALVIDNRVDRKRWPNSHCEVIRQPHQFSYYWDGKPENLPRKNNRIEEEALLESKLVAMILLLVGFPDFTQGAVYYHSTKIQPPNWTSSMSVAGNFGDHIMYVD